MKLLVVVLDGFSFTFANTFMWWDKRIKALLTIGRKRMMYIDVPAETPKVASAFFKLERFYGGGKVMPVAEYVWEASRLKCKAFNIPTTIPPVYYNAPMPREWVDFWAPMGSVRQAMLRFHDYVKCYGGADALFVWYPVPDKPHHLVFPVIDNDAKLREAIDWYGFAAWLALDLINAFRPEKALVLGDHGFAADHDYWGLGLRPHVPEALALGVGVEPPSRASEVALLIARLLR